MYDTIYIYKGKVKHCCKYCGETVRLSEYEEFASGSKTVSVDEEGYATRWDYTCKDCSVKIAKKVWRVVKRVLIFLVIVALIGGGLMLFKSCVFGNSNLYEWAMNKKIGKYESSERIDTDSALLGSDAKYTFKVLSDETDSNDYKLRLYTNGSMVEVIKYTLSNEPIMSWEFKNGFDEMSNKTYVLRNNVIYEDGDRKIAYDKSSKKYGEIMDKLSAYLPKNSCCKGKYTSASELDDPEQYLIAHIIKGDSDTVLYETTEGEYYEKTADKFIYIEICKPTEGDFVKIPEKGDYKVAE